MPAVLRSRELSRLEWDVAIGTGWRSQPKSLATYTPSPDASGKAYAPKMACAPRDVRSGYPQLPVEVAMMTLRLLRKTALGQLSWERPRAGRGTVTAVRRAACAAGMPLRPIRSSGMTHRA